ncbi:MAG: putative baseplate assembly protein [Nitrospirales bacterium]|nr:putative baseplate assembly protein [Nitrospirales bacterium]
MGLPIPKLADKNFEEIVKDARSLISRYAPDWTDHNLHDPGITFLELFAWIAEMQMYYLDRLTEEHQRKFLEMAGFVQRGQEPARVALTFGDVTTETTVPAGTGLTAFAGNDRVRFETEEEITLITASLKAVKTVSGTVVTDRTEANRRDGIVFPAFGESAEKDAALHLGFDKPFPSGDISITIFLFEDDLPPVGSHDDEEPQVTRSAELLWEYFSGGSWQSLSVRDDGTSALTGSGRVLIEGPPAMDQADGCYWIRCRLAGGRYEIAPVIETVLTNTLSARQIETVLNEDLGSGDGRPWQKRKIGRPPVFRKSQRVEVSGNGGSWETWKEVDDFEESGPGDRHYLIDAATGEISFGNGLNGRVPGSGDLVRVSYRTTLGAGGNLPAGRPFFPDQSFSGISVTNHRKAWGGRDEESLEEAQARARRDLATPYRAITDSDFEALVLTTPGLRVARAKAIPNYNPLYPCVQNFPNWVTVVVVPVIRSSVTPFPGQGFIETVSRHLDLHRLVTTGVSVVAPEYVTVSISCTIKVRKRSSPSLVTDLVNKALMEFLDPLKGGPDGDGWQFGRSVYPSEIYQVIDGVEGVDYVTGVSVSSEGGSVGEGGSVKIPPVALVCSGTHLIVAKE